jgi:hypothetical protein
MRELSAVWLKAPLAEISASRTGTRKKASEFPESIESFTAA